MISPCLIALSRPYPWAYDKGQGKVKKERGQEQAKAKKRPKT